jgi:RimJ/RimL family protein N-acetyltransferase
MHEIETARLRLRQLTRADLNDLARIVADPSVMKYLGRVPGPITPAEAETFLDGMIGHWARHGFGRWAVVEKEDGRLIGCAGFRSHEGVAELNYLLDKPYWGAGRATEIARACLRHGFAEHGFDLIVGFTRPANAASRRVMEKAGLRYVGEVVAHGVKVVRYEITREEFARSGRLGRPEDGILRQKNRQD